MTRQRLRLLPAGRGSLLTTLPTVLKLLALRDELSYRGLGYLLGSWKCPTSNPADWYAPRGRSELSTSPDAQREATPAERTAARMTAGAT